MKHHWEYKRLAELCNVFVDGDWIESKDQSDCGIRLIQTGNVGNGEFLDKSERSKFISEETFDRLKCTEIFEGDILISRLPDPIGRSCILPKLSCRTITAVDVTIVRPQTYILSNFIVHYTKSKAYDQSIESFTRGSTRKRVSRKNLGSIVFPVPPREVQEQIVAELDKINEVIEDCRELLRNLDALAQSLFYDYFGAINEYVPLSYYVTALVGGKSLASKEFCKNKVLKSGSVTYDYFDKNSLKFLPGDYIPNDEHLVKAGDVIISRMNTAELVGACAYVFDVDDNVYLPDRLWRIEYNSKANPIFLWKSLISELAKEQIRAKASGTSGSMKNISKPLLLSVQIKKTPLSLQEEFAGRIEAIEAQKKGVERTIAELRTLLDSRMDYWFN